MIMLVSISNYEHLSSYSLIQLEIDVTKIIKFLRVLYHCLGQGQKLKLLAPPLGLWP